MTDSNEPTVLHDAGEPHHPDHCPRCIAATIRKAGRDIAQAFAKLGAVFAEAFARTEETPRQQMHGPRPRRHRAQHSAPRDHRTNISMTSRSHQPAPRSARHRGYRTGGGR